MITATEVPNKRQKRINTVYTNVPLTLYVNTTEKVFVSLTAHIFLKFYSLLDEWQFYFGILIF